MMYNILQVVEPGLDGVFRHVEGLTDYLIGTAEWRVSLAYSSRRSCARLFDLAARVEASGGHTIDLATGNGPEVADLGAHRRLREIRRITSPQLIHAHSSKAGALARMGLKRHSTPILYTPHAYYGMGGRSGLKAWLFNVIEKRLGANGYTIHLSPEETEFARKVLRRPSDRMSEIANAVDFDRFYLERDEAVRENLRHEFGLPQKATVIGSIGRISFQKDPELLYRAFARARDLHEEDLWLLHVGAGEPRQESALVDLARELGITDVVVRPKYRSDPEVFYRVMDAFCLSSRYEGLPLTALEALASDLPLILTDAPGLRSFGAPSYRLNHVYYGKLEDSKSLADAMGAWLKRRPEIPNHRATAEAHFSIPVCYGRVADLYKRLIAVGE